MMIIEFFQNGGAFMYPILFVMLFGIFIAIERAVYLSRTNNAMNKQWIHISPMLVAKDFKRAQDTIARTTGPLTKVVGYGLSTLDKTSSRQDIEAVLEEGVLEVIPKIEDRTHYLAIIANIATLLGLLGTIIGLIDAFSAVAQADPAEKAGLLSRSISVAMNTTAFGLIVAIPMLAIHSILSTKSKAIIDNLEMVSIKCANFIYSDKQ